MLRPIDSEDQLPAVGRSNEHRGLDFKLQPSDDSFEIAKDVAAFANAEGGTIIIGARGKGEHLAAYVPLSSDEASKAQRTYDQAVRDRCSPSPVFSVSAIPKDGGYILAVNVWPFPGQLVGVEVKQGEARCGKREAQPDGLFFFPTRVGAHTKAIIPEHMPMFMDAKARRVAVSLHQAIGRTVILTSSKYKEKAIWMESGRVENVDLLGNSVTLIMKPDGSEVPFSLPFDVIDAVWRAGEQWHMIIRGCIETIDWMPDVAPELQKVTIVFDPDP
ncbi:MAG TPA: ATP-binding protein [Polyangiaceae bacterium]|nr:ATP-binding protein [Polyangiaceae bacterium]